MAIKYREINLFFKRHLNFYWVSKRDKLLIRYAGSENGTQRGRDKRENNLIAYLGERCPSAYQFLSSACNSHYR